MDRFDRIYKLHKILKSHRYPVPLRELEERLECSTSTVERAIRDMRNALNAPIEYDRDKNGYYLNLFAVRVPLKILVSGKLVCMLACVAPGVYLVVFLVQE